MFQCAFLIFLMVPGRCNGSIMLYQKFIRPYVLKYEKEVDSVLDEVGQFADKGTITLLLFCSLSIAFNNHTGMCIVCLVAQLLSPSRGPEQVRTDRLHRYLISTRVS